MGDEYLTLEDGRRSRRWLRSSLTRIWHPRSGVSLDPVRRAEWASGDYVVVEVTGGAGRRGVETTTGRWVELFEGDVLVGGLGSRFATLEVTGSWEDVKEDGRMEILSGGGLLGRCRSRSTLVPDLVPVRYLGHVMEEGAKSTMSRSVRPAQDAGAFRTPVILLTGTSMSAGKTSAAKVVIRRLKSMGLSVLGAKLAGAGRYRDILAMRDAGADETLDFVDGGLPSTHCDTDVYEEALHVLMGRMASVDADTAVIEMGASPLEPYNGGTAIEAVRDLVVLNILCASDPYAVVGALQAYDLVPDLVTGTTSNTEAGVDLVRRLTDLRVLDLRKPSAAGELDALLRERLELPAGNSTQDS